MRQVLPALLLTSALVVPSTGAARTPARPADSVAVAEGRRVDPRLMPLARRADVAASRTPSHATALTFPNPNPRQSVGLMVGGGAALVVGAVVGGNVGGALAVGGTVAGFYGLYHYLTRDDSLPPVPRPRSR